MKTLAVLTLLAIPLCWAASPSWFNDPTAQVGNILTVTCNGTGPDVGTAKISALNQCRAIAAEYLNLKIEFQSTTIETEHEISQHSSVSTNIKIKNLNCNPLKEETQESEAQSKVYLKCKFDLSKAMVEKNNRSDSDVEQKLSALNEKKIVQTTAPVTNIISDRKSITLTSIPMCSELLVNGKFPNVIRCKSNVIQITVSPNDKEIIVRAIGYLPKTINVSDLLRSHDESFQVVLDQQ